MVFGDIIGKSGIFIDGDWIESKDQNPNGDVRLIQLADIGEGYFKDKSDRHVTSEKAKELNCTFLKKGDILIARLGEPLCKACIFPLDGKYITAVDVAIFRTDRQDVSQKYLVYLLNSPWFKGQVKLYESGTTRKRISRKNLSKIEMPLPPLSEQERIVSRIEELFSELDQAVETLQTAKQQLAVYRQAVLKEVLESHGSCNSTLGEVILSLQNGIAKRKGADGKNIIVLRLANIDNEKILDSSEMRSIMLTDNEQESYLLNEGDGLIVRVNGSMDRVGRMVIVGINGEYAFCDHLIRCVFNKDKIIPRFAKYLLDDAVSRKHIKDNVVSTAGQNTISQGTIKSCPIYLPSLEEQRVMIQEIESRLSMCGNIEQTVDTALAQAEALRQSILKEAFEGRLV